MLESNLIRFGPRCGMVIEAHGLGLLSMGFFLANCFVSLWRYRSPQQSAELRLGFQILTFWVFARRAIDWRKNGGRRRRRGRESGGLEGLAATEQSPRQAHRPRRRSPAGFHSRPRGALSLSDALFACLPRKCRKNKNEFLKLIMECVKF